MISGLAITEFSGHATLHAFFAGLPSIKAVVPVRGSHSSRNPVFVAGFDFGGAVQLAGCMAGRSRESAEAP